MKAEPRNSSIQPVPSGKLRCYVTGLLRDDKPEEHVRQRWARSLVEEYGYERSDIDLEVKIRMGRARKSADLVVFKRESSHTQENAAIIIEAKRADVLPRDREEGIEQLKSYMAASSSSRYGLWVGAEKVAFVKHSDGAIEETVDIPSAGHAEPRVPKFSDLVPAVDLKTVLRRCHNYIYANQGLQKSDAFTELIKLIFAKVYDETESSGTLQFFVHATERRSTAGQLRLKDERILPLFRSVRDRYRYIFPENESIRINERVLAYITSELQRYSLLRTRADIKGSCI